MPTFTVIELYTINFSVISEIFLVCQPTWYIPDTAICQCVIGLDTILIPTHCGVWTESGLHLTDCLEHGVRCSQNRMLLLY